jgi:hypothetical protein
MSQRAVAGTVSKFLNRTCKSLARPRSEHARRGVFLWRTHFCQNTAILGQADILRAMIIGAMLGGNSGAEGGGPTAGAGPSARGSWPARVYSDTATEWQTVASACRSRPVPFNVGTICAKGVGSDAGSSAVLACGLARADDEVTGGQVMNAPCLIRLERSPASPRVRTLVGSN